MRKRHLGQCTFKCLANRAQTFPDADPLIGKIKLFSKIALTIETILQFSCPLRIHNLCQCGWRRHKDIFTKDQSVTHLINYR